MLFSVAHPVHALPTPISSSLSLYSLASAGSGDVIVTDSDSQGVSVDPLLASVHAHAVLDTDSNVFVDTSAAITAHWVDASRGVVVLNDFGWSTQGVTGIPREGNALLYTSPWTPNWKYSFVADKTGIFTLDYSISTDPKTTNKNGLSGVMFDWRYGPGPNHDEYFMSLDSSGSLFLPMVADKSYTVSIWQYANIGGGLLTRQAYMDAAFHWSMDAQNVSKPSSILLV